MLRINRIRLVRVGHRQAWFPDVTIATNDLIDGRPCDTILFGENGDGKSTLISLVLSCFDTPVTRFLKHMSNRSHAFHDYVSDQLGFILVEWEKGNDDRLLFADAPDRLVTGQAVVRRNDRDAGTARTFFMFDSGPGLALDAMPVDGLRTLDQLHRWTREMEQAHRSDRRFFHTEVQETWRDRLMNRGIDVVLLRNQVDFSVSEGGMDDAFLKFGSEDEFLRKFFDLTLNQGQADQVRDELADYIEKARQRPEYERRKTALEGFRPMLATFAEQARQWHAAEQGVKDLCGRLSGMRVALKERQDAHLANAAAADGRAEEARADAGRAMERQRRALADAEALEAERLRRELALAEEALRAAVEETSAATAGANTVQAARHRSRIRRLDVEIATLNQQIEARTEALEPARRALQILGSQLAEALGHDAARLRADAADLERRAREAQARRDAAGTRAEAARKEATGATGEMARAQAALSSHAAQRGQLEEAGILTGEETAQEAAGRWGAAFGLLAERLEEVEEQRRAADRARDAAAATLRDVAAGLATAEVRIDAEERFLEEAERRRLSLAGNRALCHANGMAAEVDPDAPEVADALRERLASLDRQSAKHLRRIEIWEEMRQRIEQSDIAFADADVERVCDALNGRGVSAQPFARYLSIVVKEPALAREVVASDPARFLGVHVAAHQLDAVRRIAETEADCAELALRRPVVVSVAADRPAAPQADRVVVPPMGDAEYNETAATKQKERLQQDLDRERRDLDAVERERAGLLAAERNLETYHGQHGPAARRAARERLDAALLKRAELSGLRDAAQRTEADARTRSSDLLAAMKTLTAERERAHGSGRRCLEFWTTHESGLDAVRRQLAASETRLTAVQAEEEAARRAADAAFEEARGLAEKAERSAQDAGERDREAARIDHRSFEPPPPAAEALPDLRTRYETTRDAFRMRERDQIGVLVERRDSAVESRNKEIGDLGRVPRPWNQEDAGRLGALDEAALDQEQAAARRRLDRAKTAEDGARTASSAAQARRDDQAKARRHPEHAVEGAGGLDAGALAMAFRQMQERAAAADRERQEAVQAAQAATDAAGRHRAAAERVANGVREIDRSLPDQPAPPPALTASLPDGDDGALAVVRDALDRLAGQERAERAAKDAAGASFDRMKQALQRVRDLERERRLADAVAMADFTAAAAGAETLLEQLDERITALGAEMERFADSRRIVVEALSSLLAGATRTLFAAAAKTVPAAVTGIGGLAILKIGAKPSTLHGGEARSTLVGGYVDQLNGSAGDLPRSGAWLAAALMRHMADAIEQKKNAPLKLRILKPKDNADDLYMPVDRVTASGGEGLTTAILLYCVLAQLRAEQTLNRKGAAGGVLILDNPFAKANRTNFVQAQRQMARALGLQLIYATGLKDYNALGQFQRFWRLRPARRAVGSGRLLIEVQPADMQIASSHDEPDLTV